MPTPRRNTATIHPRLTTSHVHVLDVIRAAEDVTTSGAVRWLIESYARSLRNPDLLDALPVELHDQVPNLWMVVTAEKAANYDAELDAPWVQAHHRSFDTAAT